MLAQLNCAVLSLMDRLGVRNVARQSRYLEAHPEHAIQLLLTGRCPIFLEWESPEDCPIAPPLLQIVIILDILDTYCCFCILYYKKKKEHYIAKI